MNVVLLFTFHTSP